MEPILISRPYFYEDELDDVIDLFEAGLQHFHLRKPGSDLWDLSRFIGQIPVEHRSKISLHNNSRIVFQYNLGGYHLTDTDRSTLYRDPAQMHRFIDMARKSGLRVTASIHDPVQQFDLPSGLDYVFLSPVFDSISKPGHKRNEKVWQIPRVNHHRKAPLIALGGIHANNAPELLEHGFDGVAVLGSVWNASDPVAAWKNLQLVCATHTAHSL